MDNDRWLAVLPHKGQNTDMRCKQFCDLLLLGLHKQHCIPQHKAMLPYSKILRGTYSARGWVLGMAIAVFDGADHPRLSRGPARQYRLRH